MTELELPSSRVYAAPGKRLPIGVLLVSLGLAGCSLQSQSILVQSHITRSEPVLHDRTGVMHFSFMHAMLYVIYIYAVIWLCCVLMLLLAAGPVLLMEVLHQE